MTRRCYYSFEDIWKRGEAYRGVNEVRDVRLGDARSLTKRHEEVQGHKEVERHKRGLEA